MRLTKEIQGQATTRYVQDLVGGLPNVLAESTGSATTHYVYGSTAKDSLIESSSQLGGL